MKKLIQALCVAAMVFAFASCDKDDTTPTPNYPLDGTSWLNDFPVKGRTNYPLFFDRDYNEKPIIKKVIKIFQ